jgi:hypothetical protein
MKLSRGFSLRAAILLIAAIAVGLALWRWNDAGPRYRRTGDAVALNILLKDRIHNGDSIGHVSRILGPGRHETDAKYRADAVNSARRNSSEYPQGGQDTDEFYSWSSGRVIRGLQFRGGRLINHNPAVYPLKPSGILSD